MKAKEEKVSSHGTSFKLFYYVFLKLLFFHSHTNGVWWVSKEQAYNWYTLHGVQKTRHKDRPILIQPEAVHTRILFPRNHSFYFVPFRCQKGIASFSTCYPSANSACARKTYATAAIHPTPICAHLDSLHLHRPKHCIVCRFVKEHPLSVCNIVYLMRERERKH